MLNKLQMQIKSLERHSGISQRVMILGTDDLNQCSDEELKAYLEYLRNGRRLDDSESGITEADIQETEPSEITSTDIPVEERASLSAFEVPPAPIAAASPEVRKIAVAPAIENHQCAWTLACCYLWLTSKNMSERKGVVFTTPRPFRELAEKNFLPEVPDQAEWTTWNRLHSSALDKFLTSKESIEEYEQALKQVMCETSYWWREKYLATCETTEEV